MALISATLGKTLPNAPQQAGHTHKRSQHVQALLITDNATIQEIDEALTYAQQLQPDQRGPGWHAFVDRLLEMRNQQQNTGAPQPAH
jgi:hypothetical protein